MPVVVIVDALAALVGSVVAVIGSMGAIRVLILSWKIIRLINSHRRG